MAAVNSLFRGAVDKQVMVELKKKGKTEEQKRVIDFFVSEGGCGCLNKGFGSPMTMDSYMKMVGTKLQELNIRQKAIERIGLDESQISEIAPIVFSSYVFDDSDDLLVKSDGNIAVSSQFSTTWIFFSAEQMFTYNYIFDMTSDNTWEFTRDFFYTDIIGFKTTKRVVENIKTVRSSGCIFKKATENYLKNNYIIDKFAIVTAAESYQVSMRNSETIEQSIQAARAMLREKKYSK